MHLKRKLVVMAVAVTALAASLGVVASANAATGTITCEFTGLAGGITPAIQPISNAAGGLLEAGAYNFGGTGTCAGRDQDGVVHAGTAQINSSGSFLNLVCGTGTATGNPAPGGTTVTIDGKQVVTQTTYNIAFVGGNGALAINGANGGVAAGGGYVNIVPTNLTSGGCATAPVTSFNVTGSFSAVVPLPAG